jgi:predicted CoA-binding protein
MSWQENLVTSSLEIRNVILQTKRIAVLGIKTEKQADQPSFYVPQYLATAGFEIIPVPVYYPGIEEILGKQVFRKLTDIPDGIDMVDVFRRPQDLHKHTDDILTKQPKAVWLQSGIRHDAIAEQLAKAGIKVVQDRCLMVEHRRASAGR